MYEKNSKIDKNDFDGNIVFGGKIFHDLTKRKEVIANITQGKWGQDFFTDKSVERTAKLERFDILENCPCCKSKEIYKSLNINGLIIFTCRKCLLGFQNPRVKKEWISEIYKNTYVMDQVYDSESAVKLDKIKFKYGLQVASKYKFNLSPALDVGCGTGLSLDTYSEFGIEKVFGIDPGKYTNSASDKRIEESFLDNIPDKFNGLSLITLWDTLEHIYDYKNMIISCYKCLASGGLCLILVPNFYSLATRLMRNLSPVFQIDHIYYFSLKSLCLSLTEAGFSIVHSETVISEIDNCRNYLEFNEPYFSIPQNDKSFSWLTPEYIHENKLGSRLLIVAKKN